MINTGNKTKSLQDLTEQEYHLLNEDSYSTIKTFMQSFKKYHKKYILKEEQIEKDSQFSEDMRFGSICDTIKFEHDKFEERFLIASANVPTGQMLEFTNTLYQLVVKNTNEFGVLCGNLDSFMNDAYSLVGFKRDKIDKIKERFVTEGMAYFEQLRDKGDKLLISTEEFEWANNVVNYFSNHPHTRDLFSMTTNDRYEVIPQYRIIGQINGLPVRGMLDLMIIDHQEKTIHIYDLKIMGNSSMFPYSYLKMFYYIQNGVYTTLIREAFPDYIVTPIEFVVIDKYYSYVPVIIETTEQQYLEAMNGFTTKVGRPYAGLLSTIEELKWHRENSIWDCSKKIYDAQGHILLELSNFEEIPE